MKPRALDLFCGAGGASMGLHRAGFDVTGVDIKLMPRYPFTFIQGDALEANCDGFEFIWASPPCQAYTVAGASQRKSGKIYPDLMAVTREKLVASGKLYIIENVPGAPMRGDVMLCGSMFGLRLVRHRYFETNYPHLIMTKPCQHHIRPVTVCGDGTPSGCRKRNIRLGFPADWTASEKKDAMGIDWMRRNELCQAIPPAYSEFLGKIMITSLQ